MSDDLKSFINKVADGKTLSQQEATEAFDIIMSTRNAYERYEMEKLEQSSKKSA